ncbi:LamG-like jellyroll fold domain-containing protein [Spongiactinospora rosea]|nr:LamG-like jellyroll fold domain-containing protein [Spongiactinospora rosea]
MRSINRHALLTLIVTVLVLPGLISVQAIPAWAEPQAETVLPNTPDQAIGTAAGVPSLVGAAATQAKAGIGLSSSAVKRPKNALLLERSRGKASKPDPLRDSTLPPGVRRANQKDAATVLDPLFCLGYYEWERTRFYTVGSRVSHKERIYERIGFAGSGDEPTPGSSTWKPVGWCPPSVDSMTPTGDQLMTTLTPKLTALGSTPSGAPLRYRFDLCRIEGDTSHDCVYSDFLPIGTREWTPPAGSVRWSAEYEWTVIVSDTETHLTAGASRTFVTGVRQPPITSQLSARGGNGQEFHELAGNYTTSFTDANVTVAGPPLSVVRSYNSMDPRRSGAFGAGWSTRWDSKIIRSDFGGIDTLLVTYPDGHQARYAANGDGTYQPPPGVHATLAEVSGGWRLMDKSSTSYLFDAQGRLTKVTDARGRSQELIYGADGKLTKATSVGGRSLYFAWAGEHVSSVSTDSVDGAPLAWTYAYTGDQLSKVCAPMTAPNCTTFSYTDGSLYRSVILDSDPYGYWRLGEASGSQAVGQGWGAGNGTYDSVTYGQPGALGGTGDTSVNFGNSHEAGMYLPQDALANLGTQTSVEAWFKTAVSGIIASAGTSSGGGMSDPLVYVGTDGKLRGSFRRTLSPITTANAVNDNQWHHVVLTVSGPTQILYLDGQQVGTLSEVIPDYDLQRSHVTVGNGWPYPHQSPGVPGQPGTQQPFRFQGSIDEFALYDKALSPAEIQRHTSARAGVPHRLTKITLPSGRIWGENEYDSSTDRLKKHTDHHGGTWQLGAPSYDAGTGRSTVTVTDPHNKPLQYVYDAWRNYRLIKEIDQTQATTEYYYDTGGYLSEVIDRNGQASKQTHDKRGNMLSRTTCRSATVCKAEYYTYHVNEADPFDPRNDQMIASRDERSASATDDTYVTKWELDAFGEVVKETTPGTPDFPSGRSMTYAFTDGNEDAVGGGKVPAGLLKSEKEPGGGETSYGYNAAGDVVEVTDPAELVLTFEYDVLGRERSRKETSSANPDGVTTRLTYDGAGRLSTHTGAAAKNEITGVTHSPQTRYSYTADGLTATQSVVDLTGGDPERKISYTYDTYGRVESVTGPEGGVVRYTWDHTGVRTSVTDEMGNVSHYTYTARGELASRILKSWTGSPVTPHEPRDLILESYTYDPEGRLAARVDSMGRKLAYKYYGDGSLATVTAEAAKLNGSTTPRNVVLENNTYDVAGNLIEQVTGGGKEKTTYVYDAASRLTSKTFDPSALARKTSYVYDADDNVIKETETAAGTDRAEATEYGYNADGAQVRRAVENGDTDLVTTWTVDDRGLVTEVVDPRGNLPGADRAAYTTTYRYDAAEHLVEVREPKVKIEKSGVPTNEAHPTQIFGYDSAGRRTHSKDAEGRVSAAAYDRLGRMTAVSEPPYTPPGGTSITPTRRFGYDAAGRMNRYADERGSVWTSEYDALGNRVRVVEPGTGGQPGGRHVYEYDTVGEMLAGVDPTGARTEWTYDDLGRQITATIIERKPTAKAIVSRIEYDDAGRKIKELSPGNRTITYTVNAAGETTRVTDPLGDTTAYAYDLDGRTVKVTDPLGNAQATEYDRAGREVATKDLNSSGVVQRTVTSDYDAAGNMIAETSGEGSTVRYKYDASDALVELVEPVADGRSITTTYGYDATGALTRATDGRGNTTWTTYNSMGLVEDQIEPATPAHPQPADRTWSSVYDAGGNVTSAIQPGGVRVDRHYDELGRVIKETGTGAQVATPERTYGYDLAGRESKVGDYSLEYNDRGLLTKVSKGTSQTAAFGYDDLGNVTQRTDTAGAATFGWDIDDRLQTASDPVTGRQLTYGYDKADRLTSLASTNPATTQSFGYDAMDRITSHTLKNGSNAELAKLTYGWDKDDQLISKVTSGTAGGGTNTYSYDGSGRLISWKAPNGNVTSYEWDASGNRTKAGNATFTYDERNRLLNGDGTDYTYTPRGSLASEATNGVTRNLTFDAFDRMVSDGDATYTYDAMGRLESRSQSGNTERFQYSGIDNDIVSVTDGAGAVQAKYGRDPSGALLSLQEGNGPAVGVMSDQHDDVVATFSGTALVDSTAYDPFGEVIAQNGARRRLGYQGEYTDPDTGKVNMLARWYIPGTGGFTSRDDANLSPYPSANLNRYTYAMGDPLAYTDPSGNCPICIPLLFAAGRVGGQLLLRRLAQRGATQVGKRLASRAGQAAKRTGTRAMTRAQKKVAQQATKTAQNALKKALQQSVKKAAKKATKAIEKKIKKQIKQKLREQANKKIKQKIKEKVKQHTKKKTQQKIREKAKSKAQEKVKKKSSNQKTKSKSSSKTKTKSKSRSNSSTKTKKKSSSNDDKIEMISDGIDMFVGEINGGPTTLEPLGIDLDLNCVSLRGCAKDLVENLVDNTTDQVVDEIIDEVAPDLPPIDTPGDGSQGCRLRSNSFVPGTPVLMADGSTKPIEDVKVGDYVLATDPEAGYSTSRPITTVITGDGVKNLVEITVDIDGPRGNATDEITATDEHPFWVPALHEWVGAARLQPGMWLQTSAGTYVQITALDRHTATQRVHNLTVADVHTYHVLAGSHAALVHNDNPLSDDECFAIADGARDEERERMSKTQRQLHVMIVGVVDCTTGLVVVGKKRSRAGDFCAEDDARNRAIEQGADPTNLRYGHPVYPNTMMDADFCDRCRTRIDPSQVPPDRRW